MAFTGDLSQLWSDDEAPPPKLLDVLTQIAHFLDQLGYNKTFASLYKEAKKNNLILDIAEWERGIQAKTAFPLLDLYEEWQDANDKFPTLPGPEGEEDDAAEDSSREDSGSDDESDKDEAEGVLVDVEAEETSDDDSDQDSSSDSDDSDASPTKAGVKRKRVLTPSSSEDSDDSASDSDDSSSSEDSDAPPAKKAKVQSSSSSSDSDSDSSDSSDDSSSDSDSDAGADDGTSSDSEDEKDEEPQPAASDKKKKNGGKSDKTTGSDTQAKDAGSQSSATLEGESSGEKEEESEEPNHVHPDRLRQVPAPPSKSTKKQTAAEAKKQVVPFSRIPTDQKVDPRFSSNDYVSYDYADRAYRDLSVTKGKGFTKEKNKKKRGAYRGGMIDLTPKGIKFED